MKIYREVEALDGGEWSVSRSGYFIPGERDPLPIRYEAEWAPELVCRRYGGKENLEPGGYRIPAVQLVASRYTELSRHYLKSYIQLILTES
jgi:hypothetical protein